MYTWIRGRGYRQLASGVLFPRADTEGSIGIGCNAWAELWRAKYKGARGCDLETRISITAQYGNTKTAVVKHWDAVFDPGFIHTQRLLLVWLRGTVRGERYTRKKKNGRKRNIRRISSAPSSLRTYVPAHHPSQPIPSDDHKYVRNDRWGSPQKLIWASHFPAR